MLFPRLNDLGNSDFGVSRIKSFIQAWWPMPIIPELWRLRQVDQHFKAGLSKFRSILDNVRFLSQKASTTKISTIRVCEWVLFWEGWQLDGLMCEDFCLLYNFYSLDYFTGTWMVKFQLILYEKLITLLKNNCLILSSKALLEDGKGFLVYWHVQHNSNKSTTGCQLPWIAVILTQGFAARQGMNISVAMVGWGVSMSSTVTG